MTSLPTDRGTSSYRAQFWDYKDAASYFITINLQKRWNHLFGEVEDRRMILSEIGMIAQEAWYKTPELRPDMNLTLGSFVVMPEHLHGIITIGDNKFNTSIGKKSANDIQEAPDAISILDEIENKCHEDKMHKTGNHKFAPQSKNLSSIIRGYKAAVTVKARQINPEFTWLKRYYDRVIRNEEALMRVSAYIENNPKKWHQDHHQVKTH